MRRLVACEECRRQFDGSDLAVGDRFRCQCGHVVCVGEEKAHDAAVVRCSSCGGARTKGDRACGFCGADFTIHEQDLHTVCPECLTRISDRAKFCHSCGTAIVVTGGTGAAEDKECPTCGPEKHLFHRNVGERKVPFLECHVCAGMWLTPDSFRLLADEARDRVLPPELTGSDGNAESDDTLGPQQGRMYRKCPDCSEWMHRKNFGSRSGVIVDLCKLHGVWFDNGELVRLLGWIKGGGEKLANQRAAEEAKAQQSSSYHQGVIDRMARAGGVTFGGGSLTGSGFGDSGLGGLGGGSAVGAVVHLIDKLFD